jgi:hypothetical protein
MPISCKCSMALAWVGLLACSPRSSSMVDLQLDVDQAFDQPPSAIVATRGFICNQHRWIKHVSLGSVQQ